jgi:hypothetical protein
MAAQQVEIISGLPRFESEASRQWLMNQGRTVFSQLISFLPDRELRRCVARYQGGLRRRGFSWQGSRDRRLRANRGDGVLQQEQLRSS